MKSVNIFGYVLLQVATLTLIRMASSSPDAEWPKIWSVYAVPSLQLIQKLEVRTLTKCQSLNSLLTLNKRYIQLLLFWFHFLDLLIKLMKMMLLYILYCPPPPLPRECKDLLFPWPSYMRRFIGPPPTLWPISGRGRGDPSRGHVFGWRGEGGDRCKTTKCGMAKDTKDPCICHIDTSHAERPRTEASLPF